jgi:hypothetical protein
MYLIPGEEKGPALAALLARKTVPTQASKSSVLEKRCFNIFVG